MKQSLTLFISDLHLQPDQPHIAKIFLQFLQEQASQATRLYILGDLFEAWIGDDDLNAFNLQIIQALKQAAQTGLSIYFMRGNRDFLISKKFSSSAGITLLTDPSVIDLYGKRTLLMHGDSLCTLDRKHQRFRRVTHHPFFHKLVLSLPLKWRRQIGAWLRQQSRQHQSQLSDSIMDICQETAASQMQTYQTPLLIHGHTHRPGFHQLEFNNQSGQRIVLGAWHHAGHVLACSHTGYELREF